MGYGMNFIIPVVVCLIIMIDYEINNRRQMKNRDQEFKVKIPVSCSVILGASFLVLIRSIYFWLNRKVHIDSIGLSLIIGSMVVAAGAVLLIVLKWCIVVKKDRFIKKSIFNSKEYLMDNVIDVRETFGGVKVKTPGGCVSMCRYALGIEKFMVILNRRKNK